MIAESANYVRKIATQIARRIEMKTRVWVLAVNVLFFVSSSGSVALAQAANPAKDSNKSGSPPAGRKDAKAGFPDVIKGLKATPGCLGVETARTPGGKLLVFAWFENKKAVSRWYYSEVHQEVMHAGF